MGERIRMGSLPHIVTALLPRWRCGFWWQRQAARSIDAGWVRCILGRSDDDLYLLRCWLVKPRRQEDSDLDSSDSVLLHWFPRGDDDQALHDHPWDFTTTILDGGYYEHLPPAGWSPDQGGPSLDAKPVCRAPGDTIHHAAEDLHSVGRLLIPGEVAGYGGGCWTLVRTGRSRREWGFHPHGQPWMPWREFIDQRRQGILTDSQVDRRQAVRHG